MTLQTFYETTVHPLILPLLQISLHGVAIDHALRTQALHDYEAKERDLTTRFHALVGGPLDPHSPKQLMTYVYDQHHVKPITRHRINVRGERLHTQTLDETAIEELLTRSLPPIVQEALRLVLEIRGTHKVLATYLKAPLDPDGRLRCSYVITGDREDAMGGTTTGRLSSRKTPHERGTNLQNVPPGVARQMVIPDPGLTFVMADLSQAEARVVAYLAQETRLIQVFEEGGDIHRKNATAIFRTPEASVTPEQRQLAKKIVHACVDQDTEVLTLQGWKAIPLLLRGESIAQWNAKTQAISFKPPKALHSYPWTPGEPLTAWIGPAFNQWVTPNHRMPYFTNKSIKTATSRHLEHLPSVRLPTAGLWSAQTTCQDWWIRLLTAIQADGTFVGRKVVFHLKKPRKIARLTALLEHGQIPFKQRANRDGTVCIRFPDNGWARQLGTERLWGPWLLLLSAEALEAVIEELPYWDGSRGYTSRCYHTSIEANARWMQTIIHLRGRQAKVNRGTRCWRVSINRRRNARRPSPQQVPYERPSVYCLTTQTGYFMIRRQGHISITGNSNYGMGPHKFAQEAGVSKREAQDLLNRYFQAYPGIKLWHLAVEHQLRTTRTFVTPLGRRRQFLDAWSEELVRQAYAFVPQSTVSDLLNLGLVAYHREGPGQIVLQIHDAIVVQVPPEQVDLATEALHRHLTRPISIHNRVCTIPVGIKTGPTWDALH